VLASLCAGDPAEAQQAFEFGPQVTAVAAEPGSIIAGGYGAVRSLGRSRFALTAGLGAGEGGSAAWRTELTAHFLLNPRARTGVGAYVGGGAAAADAGDGANGYVVLLAGLEGRPGGASGWALEAGLGGGFRISAGWRWRTFPPNWRFRP
jgi:hypothetical protein